MGSTSAATFPLGRSISSRSTSASVLNEHTFARGFLRRRGNNQERRRRRRGNSVATRGGWRVMEGEPVGDSGGGGKLFHHFDTHHITGRIHTSFYGSSRSSSSSIYIPHPVYHNTILNTNCQPFPIRTTPTFDSPLAVPNSAVNSTVNQQHRPQLLTHP